MRTYVSGNIHEYTGIGKDTNVKCPTMGYIFLDLGQVLHKFEYKNNFKCPKNLMLQCIELTQ